ncbi:hypothetical protein CKO15_11885 [Halorhodospira abdelmalekii]|nr:hypothetical protein [Halorhodospira abdelmalekii]
MLFEVLSALDFEEVAAPAVAEPVAEAFSEAPCALAADPRAELSISSGRSTPALEVRAVAPAAALCPAVLAPLAGVELPFAAPL